MKLKLNIQRFSSTNVTTHYELSQYIGTDKPTYLVDYNSDMNKIDTAIYTADSQATQNANNIGTMSNLNTTEKSSLVGAINEVNTQVGTNTNNISTNTSNIGTLGTNQGVMANLTTTEKSSLVGAINEVDAENATQTSNIGSLSNLETTNKSNLVSAVNEVFNLFNLTSFKEYTQSSTSADLVLTNCVYDTSGGLNLTCATNSDGTVFKLYGFIKVKGTGNNPKITLKNTGLNPPATAYTISNIGVGADSNSSYTTIQTCLYGVSFDVLTNGDIEINLGITNGVYRRYNLFPCFLINKDFGDTPE